MPLYDYECGVCHRVVEQFRRYVDRDSHTPNCCNVPSRRIISLPRVVMFKPYVNHNLDTKPIKINSRNQDREEYKRRGHEYTR